MLFLGPLFSQGFLLNEVFTVFSVLTEFPDSFICVLLDPYFCSQLSFSFAPFIKQLLIKFFLVFLFNNRKSILLIIPSEILKELSVISILLLLSFSLFLLFENFLLCLSSSLLRSYITLNFKILLEFYSSFLESGVLTKPFGLLLLLPSTSQ